MSLYELLIGIVVIIGVIMAVRRIKQRNAQQRKKDLDEWFQKADALRLATEKAAIEDLTLASRTLRLNGMWFDMETNELHLPDVFWTLDPKNVARTLTTIFKAYVRDHINSTEPEDSCSNQRVIDACIQGLIEVLKSRVQADPKGTLEVINFLVSPGQSPEDSIRSLLTIKRASK